MTKNNLEESKPPKRSVPKPPPPPPTRTYTETSEPDRNKPLLD